MKKQIENLINNAIDDFNSKWQLHEERNTGVSEYAEKIVKFISDIDSFDIDGSELNEEDQLTLQRLFWDGKIKIKCKVL